MRAPEADTVADAKQKMDLGVFHTFSDQVRVSTVLPSDGVTYSEVPTEYGLSGDPCTIVNGGPVLVEPGSRRVVGIIDLGAPRRTCRQWPVPEPPQSGDIRALVGFGKPLSRPALSRFVGGRRCTGRLWGHVGPFGAS